MEQSRTFPSSRPRFTVHTDPSDREWSRVSATGDLDLAAVAPFEQVIAAHTAGGRTSLQLDLGDVSFMDCSCLRVLIDAHLRMQERGGKVELIRASAPVVRLLTATHLHQLLMSDEAS